MHILMFEHDEGEMERVRRAFAARRLIGSVHVVRDVMKSPESLHFAAGVMPSAIVLDLVGSDRAAIALTERLKRDPRTRHVPVVALLGATEEETIEAAYRAGANSVVVRAADPETRERVMGDIGAYWTRVNQPPD